MRCGDALRGRKGPGHRQYLQYRVGRLDRCQEYRGDRCGRDAPDRDKVQVYRRRPWLGRGCAEDAALHRQAQGASLEAPDRFTGKRPDRRKGHAGRTAARRIMKYIVVCGDGMADEPLAELGGKTPLEYARIPNMDRMAKEGACGMLSTIPDNFEAGSDIANMSILGYAPEKYYTGRGPLEALNMGVDLAPGDVAYRCNLVTVNDGIMKDFSAGHISSAEGTALLASLQGALPGVLLKAGISYRNLLVVRNGRGAETAPAHDIVGEKITDHLPSGGDAEILLGSMEKSREVFHNHPVNAARMHAGKAPATQVWPYSGGKKPAFPLFSKKYGKKGGIISAV